jgi:hypothetical protein
VGDPLPHWPQDYNFDNGNPYDIYERSEEMTDVVTPGYHTKIKKGEIVNSPCLYKSKTYYAEEHPDGPSELKIVGLGYYSGKTWEKVGGNFTANWVESLTPADDPRYLAFYPLISLPSYNTDAEAKQKALANVDSTPYEFFEDLLEIRETVRLLRDPLSALRDLSEAYKRAKRLLTKRNPWLNSKQLAKAHAGLWNQYRFAFSPLVRSLLSGYEAFEKWETLERPPRRNSHYRSEADDKKVHRYGRNVGGYTTFYVDKSCTVKKESHASILYEVTNPLVNWNFKLGLRSKDIPYVAWQIMPLSFMVDRLVDISSAIGGLMNLADPAVVFLAGSVTTRKTISTRTSVDYVYTGYGVYQSTPIKNPDAVVYDKFEYERVIWNPTLGDIVPVPNWTGLVEDFTKTLDLIAIITSNMK